MHNMKHPQTNEEFDKKWNPIYKEKINLAHDSPSPETRERLTALEINQQNIMEKLIEFQEDNKEQHNKIVDSLNKLEQKLDSAIEKKADKTEVDRIRGIIQWVSYTIIGGVIVALLALVLK